MPVDIGTVPENTGTGKSDGTATGIDQVRTGDIPGISREPYDSNYEYKKRSAGF